MQPHTLKRTISKCSMDGDDALACKKFSAGLDNEPVLLPRRSFPPLELSPAAQLWGGSPAKLPSFAPPPDDRSTDDMSAARVVAVLLDYLRDVARYCNRALLLSFTQLRQMLASIPLAVGHMQSVAKTRLALSWPLAAAFVQNVTDFISDEDIRDASVGELAAFLQSWGAAAPACNICANLFEFFREALAQFKAFLTKRWLQSGRISFPCEFGKKSDALFLCMECHREHL
ncbi:hypothetical protein PF005_g9765 [Phytophthora fragariae]|uniref:Uncharacterized protein n=1 Tax=Phytophthora fragariae TaxID=53985 RepID=A0A6A4CXP5_9STRA|nr:hypothetical protein PF003_g2147 [Phytophthora fragariae]KAE8938627.1 hypothetical protein PF009_g11487 [Phytophthora fragariae]KAE9005428.1 hypothetical protein PF011_g12038 [Phytophthora fragariae]KAE9106309.1 hypothetical protein PF010_g12670 [Phytophthora fragariae]KAE9106539.1 hypothetical protein PF007_g13358 [Phytophthora fragariae]